MDATNPKHLTRRAALISGMAAAIFGAGIGLTGCLVKPAAPLAPFVDASEYAAFESVGPELEAYIDADPSLTIEDRQRRQAAIDAWRDAVVSARAYLDE